MTTPTTDPLIVRFALEKFDEMVAIVAGLDDATANTTPDVPGANSPYALLTHCLGMMRYWSSTANRGIEVPRDRAAEFVATGPVAELVERAGRVRAEFLQDCRAADLTAAPANPPSRADLADASWLATTEGVLLHVVEELCQHLGHLEITRDVLAARAGT